MPAAGGDNKRKKPGPKPKRLKAEGADWEEAIKHSLRKSKPKDGWPKRPKGKDGEHAR
ncbi:MAG: hypothetical protein IH830_00310 [Planctomycetes bacterium]|nr:hypothetical protein [Planctomycetota bacterium]